MYAPTLQTLFTSSGTDQPPPLDEPDPNVQPQSPTVQLDSNQCSPVKEGAVEPIDSSIKSELKATEIRWAPETTLGQPQGSVAMPSSPVGFAIPLQQHQGNVSLPPLRNQALYVQPTAQQIYRGPEMAWHAAVPPPYQYATNIDFRRDPRFFQNQTTTHPQEGGTIRNMPENRHATWHEPYLQNAHAERTYMAIM